MTVRNAPADYAAEAARPEASRRPSRRSPAAGVQACKHMLDRIRIAFPYIVAVGLPLAGVVIAILRGHRTC